MVSPEQRLKTVVILAALSASGKTEISKELGQQINAPVINLRDDLLRPIAAENGYPQARWWILDSTENPEMLQKEWLRLA